MTSSPSTTRQAARPARDWIAVVVVLVVAAGIGEAAIFLRPELTLTTAFIFGDQAYSLFVASEIARGARLYQDVAYPYGWLPVFLYRPFAFAFGNSPVTYLHFLLFASVAGLTAVYAVVRRVLEPVPAGVLTVLGVVPVFVVPGSLLGGYTSAFYMPFERIAIVMAALVWRSPDGRTGSRAAALGAIFLAMQNIRFGPGLVLCAVTIALDAGLLALTRPPGAVARWLRLTAIMCGVLLAGEAVMAAAAFSLLPGPIATDVLWPAYMQQAFPAASMRWPAWGGIRLLLAQYINPLAGIVLTIASAWLIATSAQRKTHAAALLLPPLLFMAGAFTFFRTDHHFRQFAWMFTLGAAPALARFPAARVLAVSAWLPVFAVVVRSAAGHSAPDVVKMTTPNGWRLSATPELEARIEGIARALKTLERASPGPVLFYSNGAGFYVAYGVPHVSRETWFFPGAVRPYEMETLAAQYRSVRALVSCAGSQVLPDDFPAPLRGPLLRRLEPAVWQDGTCAVFPLREAVE